jgi:hypothetical protein
MTESPGKVTVESAVDRLTPAVDSVLRALVDDYRDRCLWFLKPDYYPASEAEALRVLGAIERHGDRAGFQRCSEVRAWLSQSSSAASAGS